MSWIKRAAQEPNKKSVDELKRFGFTMAAALLVLSLVLFWRGRPLGWLFFMANAVFIFCSIVCPRVLGPVERLWMAFAEKLGWVMTRVVLFVVFYAAITPLGFLVRVFKKGDFKVGFEKERKSYWEPVRPEGPGSRFFKPF